MTGYRPGERYPGTECRDIQTRAIERITRLEDRPGDGLVWLAMIAAAVLGFFWFDARLTTLEHSLCHVATIAGDSIMGCVR